MSTPGFDDFWLASELNRYRLPAFGERLATWADPASGLSATTQPGRGIPLPRGGSPLDNLLGRRRSHRTFSAEPLSAKALGSLLQVLAEDAGHRGHAAGGGLYGVGVTVLGTNLDHPGLSGYAAQYEPRRHELTPVGPLPPWQDLHETLVAHDLNGVPGAVLLLWADPARVLAKYGERGGRFLLIEAGSVLQSLGLAAAELGLAAVALGGSQDAEMLRLAHLDGVPGLRFITTWVVGNPG